MNNEYVDNEITNHPDDYQQNDDPVYLYKNKNLQPESFDNSNNDITSGSDLNNYFNSVFNKSTLLMILMFLGVYFVVYFGLGLFFNRSDETSNFQLRLSRILDMLFLVIVVLIIASLLSSDAKDQQQILGEYVDNTTSYINNPISIITTFLFLIAFYTVAYMFRIPMSDDTKPIFMSFIENVAWILLVIIAFVDFFKYVLGISLNEFFAKLNFWGKLPDSAPIVVDNSRNIIDNSRNMVPVSTDEVFNVSNNLYTYDDAQSICAAYSAKLATYDQIEDAYKRGAEWCNYGWSEGQMAYFPTQKSTWQELQKDKKHKNDCGRPGINGGYMANPHIKFGVNCFGKKPKPTADDLARLEAKKHVIRPKTPADVKLDAKVKYWKDNADKLLKLNSYNNKAWSEY